MEDRIEQIIADAHHQDDPVSIMMARKARQVLDNLKNGTYESISFDDALRWISDTGKRQIAQLIISEASVRSAKHRLRRQNPLGIRVALYSDKDRFPGTIVEVRQGFDFAEAVKIRDERDGLEWWFEFWKECRDNSQDRFVICGGLLSGLLYRRTTSGGVGTEVITNLHSWHGG